MASLEIPADLPLFQEAKDKVVILTGGATGIGEATVRRLHSLGAIVNVLDVDRVNGAKLAAELGAGVHFYEGSVSVWADQLRIFDGVIAQYGRVDLVFANAGIDEVVEDVFVDAVDAATGQLQEPRLLVLDVNLRGVILTTKLALSTFRRQLKAAETEGAAGTARTGTPGNTRNTRGGSLVITGSAASYLDTPGIPIYNTAKHGVLGLVRSLRDQLEGETHGAIRINLVAPAFVQTQFTAHVLHLWQRENLPINQPADIANALLFLGLNRAYHGRAIYAAGGQYAEIEGAIETTRNVWLGQQFEDWIQKRKVNGIRLGKQDE
ncbi:oxidoreductase, short chain dehydrogenase [Sporothrix schenckii 1099-18]|uniref:Oxidoreductase, short chain dehydrogenase n=1 Tax=Sporothrix schenckii 1099-18 TaxID=1397361 RepID=A0A0F2LVJ1_SPOSC|nr:oxidoreductase, short chain dehydrogenase [Sporothrix schenckii 1099-18]KJR80505.1 oxidoreductase, short chain dehydrogenase [Sporothrix schenckii 1099-18]